jgi:hypothetical protein
MTPRSTCSFASATLPSCGSRWTPAADAVQRLRTLLAAGPVTLDFAAREADLSTAAVLRDLLRSAE